MNKKQLRTSTALSSLVFCLLYLSVLSGCSSSIEVPELGGIYNRSAMYHGEERNPVILIPGILGSKLKDSQSGKTVWGAFGGNYADPGKAADVRLISLPMRKGIELRNLVDEVIANGALDRVEFNAFGIPLELGAYANILGSLGVGGYRDQQLGMAGAVDYGTDHYTCFQFGYDWRRDLVETAKTFHQFLMEKKASVEAEHKKRTGEKLNNLKFDIVAHSMGGLVLRYYLRYGPVDLPKDGSLPKVTWFGAKYIDNAVLIGTPSAGAINSVVTLIEGLPVPLHSDYPASILGTLPAVYQLMPRPRHRRIVDAAAPDAPGLNLYDPAVWQKLGWGLADPNEDTVLEMMFPEVVEPEKRRAIALEHLAKILKRVKHFHQAMDQQAPKPKNVSIHLIAGDAVPTMSKMLVNTSNGSFAVLTDDPGDGVVLRASALLDERQGQEWHPRLQSPVHWDHVTFLFQDHLGLTTDPVFVDNILYLLLEKPN